MKNYSKKAKLDYLKQCNKMLDKSSKQEVADITAEEIMEAVKDGYKRSY